LLPFSLDAQREAAQAYIASQQHQGWIALPERYDDGTVSEANSLVGSNPGDQVGKSGPFPNGSGLR
jgi:hypothetical protein